MSKISATMRGGNRGAGFVPRKPHRTPAFRSRTWELGSFLAALLLFAGTIALIVALYSLLGQIYAELDVVREVLR